jgi:hypothetical protein
MKTLPRSQLVVGEPWNGGGTELVEDLDFL